MRPGEAELRDLYIVQELSCTRISGQFGVCRQTVANWLAHYGIEQRPQKILTPGAAEVRRLYEDEKLSLNTIAKRYGTSASIVSRWLVNAGIKARSARDATMLSGKYGVHSEAHRETLRRNIKIAQAAITPEARKRQGESQRGRVAPNKGKPMSEEQRLKLIEAWQDPARREKMSAIRRGEKSHLWKGGKTPDSSLHGWRWRALRQEIYARDNWTCQDCHEKCLNTKDSKLHPKLKIQAHHILPRRYGGTDEASNLVTLCMSCHQTRERAFRPLGENSVA